MNHTITFIKFRVTEQSGEVSGIITMPESVEYFLVFAHGAGAGMNHSFMEQTAISLADNHIATLRFNFPYTEKNGKRPDPAPVLMETIRSACEVARQHAGDLPVFAGGKSMGGRMTSMAASKGLLDGITGIVFFGFPLHAPGQPSDSRAEHLFRVQQPMLFLQGTKDKLAELTWLQPVIQTLGSNAELYIVDGADHSFHLPKSSGKTDDDVVMELTRKVKAWADEIA
jgi:predicted alpha/beta-hydrolase family hydrolase